MSSGRLSFWGPRLSFSLNDEAFFGSRRRGRKGGTPYLLTVLEAFASSLAVHRGFPVDGTSWRNHVRGGADLAPPR